MALDAGLVSLADAVATMTSRRLYALVKQPTDAVRETHENIGVQFDPQIVRNAMPVISRRCTDLDRQAPMA